ncbi:MAG: hypothetical protein WD341_07000 [Tistlia sp.]|uniref:hypothetical protein n=1 Tax=Tistlia sp. TaxID=3057121 RepID=UPI0034A100B5
MATAATKAGAPERVDLQHHRYRIIAGKRGGACHAIAYLGMRKIEECSAPTVEEAVAALQELLDRRIEQLRAERTGSVPSEAEYDEALQVLQAEMTKQSMALLLLLIRLPDGAATLPELAHRLERSESAVLATAGRLGRRLGALLDFTPDPEGLDRTLAPLLVFAEIGQRDGKRPLALRLRPETLTPLRTIDQGDTLQRR